MGTGYVRQSSADIITGAVVEAAPLNLEFNALRDAFHETSGHSHDGTVGEGPKIDLTTSASGVLPVARGGFAAIHKINGTAAPTTGDDSDDGYGPGSVWIDTTNDRAYVCVDATVAAAVWVYIGNSTGWQPLDATLTALAGVATAANKLIYSTASDTFTTTDLSAFGRTIIDDADASAARTTLGLVIGTNVQAYDAELAAIAGLTSAADKGIQFTGSGTAATYDLTSYAKTLLDDANAAAARTTLGLVIGTDVQAQNAYLADIAAITPSQGDVLYFNGTDWVRLAAGTSGYFLKTQGAGANPTWDSAAISDAELLAIAGLTSAADRVPYFTGSGTASLATFTSFGRSLVDDADASAARTTLGAVIGTNVQAWDADLDTLASGNSMTEDTAPLPNSDYVVSWDASASAYKKVLHKNVKPIESFIIAISDETTAITTGTAKVTFRMPYAFTLTAVRASLSTVSSSGNPTFDINEDGVSILSTTLTIDANEKTSTTAATAAVISDTSLADDAEITIDIDTAGTGAKGAKIYLIGYKS